MLDFQPPLHTPDAGEIIDEEAFTHTNGKPTKRYNAKRKPRWEPEPFKMASADDQTRFGPPYWGFDQISRQ